MKIDLALLGGTMVSDGKILHCDILVNKGKIISVKPHSDKTPNAKVTLILNNKIILPGIIDAHTHFHLKLGNSYSSDDFDNGSAAAVCGGITTFIDYTGQPRGVGVSEGLEERLSDSEGKCYADYAFHGMVTGFSEMKNPYQEIKKAVNAGVTTFKMFTAYAARELMSRDDEFYRMLEYTKELGALVCVHCENGYIADLLTDRFAPKKGISALPLSRPAFTEIESVGRIAQFAHALNAPVYFVHLSTAGSAAIVEMSRKMGIQAMAETCPQYLLLSNKLLKGKDGYLFSCCPPLRDKENNMPLWEALDSGIIKTIASDSCSISKVIKDKWKGDIRNLSMGLPGSQTLMPSIYTYGVKKGLITIQKMVEVFCENPAKIMGLKNKGFIKKGYDADFAVIDPLKSIKVDCKKLKHNTEYSPWQGKTMYGFPDYTILRGKIVAENGELTSKTPSGKYIKRAAPQII